MLQNSLPLFLGITVVGFLTYTRLNPIPVICYGCDEGKNTWYKCIAGTGQDSKMCKNIKKMDTQADALKNSIIDQTTSGFDVIRETAEDSIEFLLKIFDKIKNTILGLTDTIVSIIKKASDFFIKSIVTVFNKIKELFIGQNSQKRDTLSDPKKKRSFLEKIKATIIDPLYNGIISIIVTPINKLIKILIGFKNKIIETYYEITKSTGLSTANFKISTMVGYALKPLDTVTDLIVKGVEKIINVYKNIIVGSVNIGVKTLNFFPNMWMAGIEKTIKLPFQSINITRNTLNKALQKTLQTYNNSIDKIDDNVKPINKAIGVTLTGVETTVRTVGPVMGKAVNTYTKGINHIINKVGSFNKIGNVINKSISFIPKIIVLIANFLLSSFTTTINAMRYIRFPQTTERALADRLFPMGTIINSAVRCTLSSLGIKNCYNLPSLNIRYPNGKFTGGGYDQPTKRVCTCGPGYPCGSWYNPSWCSGPCGCLNVPWGLPNITAPTPEYGNLDLRSKLSSIGINVPSRICISDSMAFIASPMKLIFQHTLARVLVNKFAGKTLFSLPSIPSVKIPTPPNFNTIPSNLFPNTNVPKIPNVNLSKYTKNINIPRPPHWSLGDKIKVDPNLINIPQVTPPDIKLPRNLIPEIPVPGNISFPSIPGPSIIFKPFLKIFDKLPEWLGITKIINKLKSYITPIIRPIINLISKLVSLKDVIIKGFKFVLKFLWEDVFMTIWNKLGEGVKSLLGIFNILYNFLIVPIVQVFYKVGTTIGGALSEFVSIIFESFNKIKNVIIDSFTEIFKLVFNFAEKYLKTSFAIFLYVVGTFVDKILWFLPISITWKMLIVLLTVGIIGGLGGAIIPFLKIIKSSQGTLINIIDQINNYLLNN